MVTKTRFILAVLCLFAAHARGPHQEQAHKQTNWYSQHKTKYTVGTAIVCVLAYLGWRICKNWHSNAPVAQPIIPAQVHEDAQAPVPAHPNIPVEQAPRLVVFLNTAHDQAGHEEPFANVHFIGDGPVFDSLESFANGIDQVPDAYTDLILAREISPADGTINLHLFPANLLETTIANGRLQNPLTKNPLRDICCYRLQRDRSNANRVVLVIDQDQQVANWQKVAARAPGVRRQTARDIVGLHLDEAHRLELLGPVYAPLDSSAELAWPTHHALASAGPADNHRRIILDHGNGGHNEFLYGEGLNTRIRFVDTRGMRYELGQLANGLFGDHNQRNNDYELIVAVREGGQYYLFPAVNFESAVIGNQIRNPLTNAPIQTIGYYRIQHDNSDIDNIRLMADPDEQIAGHRRVATVAANLPNYRQEGIRNLWQSGLDQEHRNQIAQAHIALFGAAPNNQWHANGIGEDHHYEIYGHGAQYHAAGQQEQHRHWWQPRHWLETVAEIGLAILVSTAGGR